MPWAVIGNARLTEQIFDGDFCASFAQKVTAEICPMQPIVRAGIWHNSSLEFQTGFEKPHQALRLIPAH